MESNFNKYKDKAVMFYSAASPKDAQQVLDAGASEILVSFHYLQKRKEAFMDIINQIQDRDGVFMTDSGAFSAFMGDNVNERTEEFWLPYLERYVEFLTVNCKKIHVAANLDLDNIVGRDIVDKWNEKYFHPLEKIVNITYVTQKDINKMYGDLTGLHRFKEYCNLYKYVGVNAWMKPHISTIVAQAKIKKIRIHGFAWTDKAVMNYPVFSVDSSSWLSGQRYGSTYRYDGKNFRAYDKKSKFRRKVWKVEMEESGMDYEGVMNDEQEAVTLFNANQWLGWGEEFRKRANCILTNREVNYYFNKK